MDPCDEVFLTVDVTLGFRQFLALFLSFPWQMSLVSVMLPNWLLVYASVVLLLCWIGVAAGDWLSVKGKERKTGGKGEQSRVEWPTRVEQEQSRIRSITKRISNQARER